MTPAAPAHLLEQVDRLLAEAHACEAAWAEVIATLPPGSRESARNLLHYLALRAHDRRGLQDHLSELGLSSLGRLEPHVLATLGGLRAVLARLCDGGAPYQPAAHAAGVVAGRAAVQGHARALFGPPPEGRTVRIMVTMPSEAATNYALVRDLLAAGMDVMRINCAHDGPEAWDVMVDHLERARVEVGRACRVHADLCGPKLRTGPLPPGPALVRWRPSHDAFGAVDRPARIWLHAGGEAPGGADADLPVDAPFLAAVRTGDRVAFVDARGRHRSLDVVAVGAGGVWATANRGAYLLDGTRLVARRGQIEIAEGVAGGFPALSGVLRLSPGDTLFLVRDDRQAGPEVRDERGVVTEPGRIGCSLTEVFHDARVGDPILFDDGAIRGVVRARADDRLTIEIVATRGPRAKLAADKGINLPETDLRVPAISAQDREDLAFVARRADIVGLSFVRGPEDVAALQAALAERGAAGKGIVLKVETRRAFEQVPAMLIQALRTPPVGMMVARGDLGVEVGFERLAEVQEELLWLGEAAHVPIVWATQVLETLARTGSPSRAEVSDAAMGERAECVMLNKGPYVVDAVRFLDDILRRMSSHQHKKRSMLRRLEVAAAFGDPPKAPRPRA